jgi:hypothetical protein
VTRSAARPHAAAAAKAEKSATRYAGSPSGTNRKRRASPVQRGYPGGWAIPSDAAAAISSPESPNQTVGQAVAA